MALAAFPSQLSPCSLYWPHRKTFPRCPRSPFLHQPHSIYDNTHTHTHACDLAVTEESESPPDEPTLAQIHLPKIVRLPWTHKWKCIKTFPSLPKMYRIYMIASGLQRNGSALWRILWVLWFYVWNLQQIDSTPGQGGWPRKQAPV